MESISDQRSALSILGRETQTWLKNKLKEVFVRTMSINFAVLKQICPYSNTIVSGFIHLNMKQYRHYIPHLVIAICLMYYHDMLQFGKHHEYMELNANQKTVKMKRDYIGSCYCYSNWIELTRNRITSIDVLINHVGSAQNNVTIGIATTDETCDGLECFKGYLYGYSGDKSQNRYLQTGDTLCIQISKRCIRFIVNKEIKREILCFQIRAKYKVVVVMWNRGTEVTLSSIVHEYIEHPIEYSSCRIL